MEEFQEPSVTAMIPDTLNKTGIKKYIEWLRGRTIFSLNENYYYKLTHITIKIPTGFKFDGASVPRPFWSKFSPTGVLLIGALIHDYAYNKHGIHTDSGFFIPYSRKDADKLFKRVLDETNGLKLLNYLPYLAVRLFGWKYFKN